MLSELASCYPTLPSMTVDVGRLLSTVANVAIVATQKKTLVAHYTTPMIGLGVFRGSGYFVVSNLPV